MFKGYIDQLRTEFTGYNPHRFLKDVMAGLTVAAVALPLALAFGVGSGATAAAGLITAIIGGFVIGGLSGASYQISGPTGAMTAILIMLAQKYGLNGIFIAGFMAGILLVLAGIFKLGRIISFIPSSVITGFTSGIAIIIALGQLDNFFGVSSHGEMAIARFFSYFTYGFSPDLETLALGCIVIVVMLAWPKKWDAFFPSSLASLILVLLVNGFFQFKVAVVGEIPKTLFLPERLDIFQLPLNQFWDFFVPALSIAALAMIESLLCGASAGKLKNEKLNGDQELIAQGIGNMLIPIFGGVPATAAIARSSVAIKSGGQTRVCGIIHAIGLLLSMFLLTPVMSEIPLSALAGVLLVTAWRMNDWKNINYIFEHKFKWGMMKFFITMVATVALDLTQAIIIGVAFSSFFILIRLTDIDITISKVDNMRLQKIGIDIPAVPKQVQVAYLTGTIFFAVVEKLNQQLVQLKGTSVLILSMRGVPMMDLSGVQGLVETVRYLSEDGTQVMLTSVQPKVLELLKRGNLIEIIGENHLFHSAADAIVYANEEYIKEIMEGEVDYESVLEA
ncbi:SulP family inorganic anion transporter [Sinanaerobacter sp. ZZT-01]|uniref:SulP family inorganic anion transporter n=1 Tax=Sinanaerobacter sp. ZZT-01 TaxID=3111540 RepID=UPI002D7A312D|nr:SulP family inorganic anion transporter [Sinanaerobacter sp. ZZT-01]WRR93527.1 SulP family inorganic anion transporter [Sinanaerobacter sp. ZZT-01]